MKQKKSLSFPQSPHGSLISLASRVIPAIRAAGALLGVAGGNTESWFQTGSNELAAEEIDALIAKRKAARDGKDFATSDHIRDALMDQGVVLEDGPDGTTWRYQADS